MSGEQESGWQLTESDPGVFSELLRTLGVPLIVDDLYSLDSESLAGLQPLHALIFLFKYVPPVTPNTLPGTPDPEFNGFFAHQTVNNACATLAVMNALGNIPAISGGANTAKKEEDPQFGTKQSEFNEMLSFANGMDPQTRGMVITSADWLREAHNALSPPSAISLDGLGGPRSTEDAYHFVVYLPSFGCVYELDGLQELPKRHGAFKEQGEGWAAVARDVIEARIATYPPGALEFSLLALRDDPIPILQQELDQLEQSGMHSEAAEVVVKLSTEKAKRERWAFENSLRRHNHVGLVHALFVALAKGKKLTGATANAKKVMKEKIAKRKERGEDAMDES